MGRMRNVIESWISRWAPVNAQTPPQLFLESGSDGSRIVDTRKGDKLVYEITEAENEVLGYVSSPKKTEDLLRGVNQIGGPQLHEILNKFDHWGLLFKEKEKMMSLVLPGTPGEKSRN